MILNILLIILTIILVGFITLAIIFWVKYGKILISLFKEMKKFTPIPNLKNHKQMFSEIDSMLKTLNNKNGKRF